MRLAVTGGTPVAQYVSGAATDQTVTLVGFPRADLPRARRIADDLAPGATFSGQFPYEMVITYRGE